MQILLLASLTLLLTGCLCDTTTTSTTPIPEIEDIDDTTQEFNETVEAPQDLYVIKTIVYEVGILTDAGNDTDLNTTHEQVDVTFFDPKHNGSLIDLTNIPVPIQTNVSGVSVTGLLPVNLGSLVLPPSGHSSQFKTTSPLFPEEQITVTQNISTNSAEKGSHIISNLPKVLGLVPRTNSQRSEEEVN